MRMPADNKPASDTTIANEYKQIERKTQPGFLPLSGLLFQPIGFECKKTQPTDEDCHLVN